MCCKVELSENVILAIIFTIDKPESTQRLVFPVFGWYTDGSIRMYMRALKDVIYYSAARLDIELANY